jgi:DNA repair protein RadC
MQARSEDLAHYTVEREAIHATGTAADEAAIISEALAILARRLVARDAFLSPEAVRQYLVLRAENENDQHVERFAIMFLDSQNRLIECESMFTGTLTQTSVYPREVVRAALRHNAAAVVLTHNHPSGSTQPSRADETLTRTLKEVLALVDVRVLDHIITAPGGQSLSMAQQGLM